MPFIDLVDETFLVADPAVVARIVADPARWRRWWPDLTLTVFMDRAVQGQRWSVAGALVGSSEIWLEPYGDGVLLHYYLRADPTARGSNTDIATQPTGPAGWRRAARWRRARALAWKRHVWALKDELQAERSVGMPRATQLTSEVKVRAENAEN